LSCWPVPRARGVLPCDIASSARQALWNTFTAPVGWKSTAFHPEVRAVHRAIQRRERRPVVATLGRKIIVGQGVGEAGDGLLGGGNGALFRGDDLIRQSGERLREPPQGQEIPERALEPTSRISHFCETTRSSEELWLPPARRNDEDGGWQGTYLLKGVPLHIRQSGDRRRETRRGQEVSERALEPPSRISEELRVPGARRDDEEASAKIRTY